MFLVIYGCLPCCIYACKDKNFPTKGIFTTQVAEPTKISKSKAEAILLHISERVLHKRVDHNTRLDRTNLN